MEAANEILKQVVPILMIPVNNYLRYIISSTQYVRDMTIKLRELNEASVGIKEHMTRNTSSHLEVPAQVSGWLDDVEKINRKGENVPREVGGCVNLKIRLKAGRNAFEISEEIDSVMRRLSLITWTDHPIPLGRVESMQASTSTPSIEHDEFQSREVTFVEALKALGPNHKGHMIALCGMGGVGKTTMMKKIKNFVEKKKMFNYVVMAVIGENTNPIAIQKAIADYLCIELNESTKPARADKLRQWFKDNSDGGKNKFLVILDDVWEFVDLEDIGLSTPLLNEGVNFKVLLTSRKRDICNMMGVEANSILNVKVLEEVEAQNLFLQFVEIADRELHQIEVDIARKCCGLPISIKTIALTLRNKSKDSWKDALARLEEHDIENVVNEVFEMSYRNLQDEETKSIFLLCGLFPEDFDIHTEELMRYGWGLNLFKKMYTIRRARTRLNACIDRLMDSNLLIESNFVGCVKMHDLVRAFVLDMYCKAEHASIVNHGNMSGWPKNNMNNSCKTISLTCDSIFEFPGDLKFPNLTVLKLMHGDKSLRFPHDFYKGMEKLQVISYDEMKYPLLPSLPQCSINLRVLHLHQCSLKMFDCSSIGNMLNLEVLSFAKSCIEWLPSTIGNLKKLRLLDLRDCNGLRIEQGVLKKLVELEELYIGNAYGFRDDNCNEMAERSNNLYALEFEFFNNNAQVKNMSFENLEQFKISVGRSLDGNISKSSHSYENTLQLVTNKCEILDSKLNELFVKTEVLCLSVDCMNELEDVEVKSTHPRQSSSFCNLRVLIVSQCGMLTYLFKLCVANTLSNLEHMEVYECDSMEELINNGTDGSGKDTILFPKLKFLSLGGLPKLLGLCNNVNIIKLPQLVELKLKGIPRFTCIYTQNKMETSSLLKDEIVIPKLETLQIDDMENLKEIWPHQLSIGEEVKLREIEVRNCDKLVNLFPYNPMCLLHHLEELEVENCGSIESLFNIDLDCVGEIGGEVCISGSLRSIGVMEVKKLREVWRIKGTNNSQSLICGFQAVESISIKRCVRFRNVFTPTTANFDLRALSNILIYECGANRGNDESKESSQEKEQTNILLREETFGSISNVVLPSSVIHSFHNLHNLYLNKYEGVEVVFEIESPTSRELVTTHDNQQPLLPNLEDLNLNQMDNMSHVWKCNNWNRFSILQKQQPESPFRNLTTICIYRCRSIKYLFSPLMAELLSNLKKVKIEQCYGIEEVVSNRDDEDAELTTFTSTSTPTSTILFPHLHSLTLSFLKNLRCIGGGGAKDGNNEMSFNNTTTTSAFVDQFKFIEAGGVSWSLCQYSNEISVYGCDALSSVIPYYAVGLMQKLQVLKITFCNGMKEVLETQGMSSNNKSGCDEEIPRVNNVVMLPNLKILNIEWCGRLEHIFTFSALESLRQLQELTIRKCRSIKVIVKKEEDASSKEAVVFPRLKSIELEDLPELVGFFLGMNEFRWPSLDKAYILLENVALTFMLRIIRPYSRVYTVVPCYFRRNNLLQKLEKICVSNCEMVDEIFETALEGSRINRNSSSGDGRGFDESSQTTILVNLPNLTQLELKYLFHLTNIWKSNQWTIFEFPSLTRVDISWCNSLEHVFTSSMVSSLLQLQELSIFNCSRMEEVIVKDVDVAVEAEEESDGKRNEMLVLPCLTSLKLERLPCLKGFSLGNEEFSFPLLDTLIIKGCSEITTFTKGNSTAPQLKEIEISFGSFYAGENINSFIRINKRNSTKAKTLLM
ncbi:unnamed protein product [Lactuca saligna]|uniref:AAA+ ATPase domain-containing protein n=1 Tax=Lactuca saligna TaxID=75948 RepID=A0AA35Y7D4_LACSI|nr:unnamed protein product [Lactuca saligna]